MSTDTALLGSSVLIAGLLSAMVTYALHGKRWRALAQGAIMTGAFTFWLVAGFYVRNS